MNYTLMGDNVNLGARLEGTNKAYGTTIIMSEYTYGLVKDKVIARELDNIRVKGKNRPVLIYELIDVVDGQGGDDGNG
jgi:adenylate cyclase